MLKIALGVEYDGSQYYGWQRQKTVPSIQAILETALGYVASEPITLFCAGRTDAGVHATNQVVHFETSALRPDVAWTMGVNANLPGNIVVRWARSVPCNFHARFSALARRYRYIIYNNQYRPAILHAGMLHYHSPLDEVKMHNSAKCLLGENDFSAFRAAQCQSKTPWRYVHHVHVCRFDRYIMVDIKANAFVHHMVRNIVGSLLEVGCGRKPEDWIAELLTGRNRTLAAATAKAKGLYLVDVGYPAEFNLPKLTLGPLFIDSVLM